MSFAKRLRMIPESTNRWGKKNTENELSAWLLSGLFGVLTGTFLGFGYQLEKLDRIDLTDKNFLLVMLLIIAVVTFDTKHVWTGYDLARNNKGKKFLGLFDIYNDGKAIGNVAVDRSTFLKIWGALILLNLPVLLAEFPGFFVYDAQEELNEVLTRTFTTHHPLLHVLLLGGTIALVHKLTGSWNIGICTYIFIQMLIITAVFTCVICFMKKRGIGQKSRILTTLYYGLFPTIVMFTLCSTKDGLFSALLLLLTVFLIELVSDKDNFLADKRKVFTFVITAVLMPCFRHNGFYAYLVFVPFALFYFRKELKKSIVIIITVPVVIYLVINTALSSLFSSEITHHQELLTVPIMQLARVYTYERESLSDKELSTLMEYIPEENLNLYTERVSDLIKIGFDNEKYEKDRMGFWTLWFSQLKKHPVTYINAWFLTSYGYWYPAAKINVYKGNTVYTFTYEDNSYFGYEVELPGERHSFIPAIDSFYRYISIGCFFIDYPILALLFSPGLMIIMYLFVFAYRLSKGKRGEILPFLPMLLTYLTVILGPTYLVRYVVYLWLCFPLLFIPSFDKEVHV